MSEEILKALMQLFAIISKQDDGVSEGIVNYVYDFLKFQLPQNKAQEYLQLFNEFSAEEDKKNKSIAEKEAIKSENYGNGGTSGEVPRGRSAPKLTSMKDSVRILAICKKINKTLNQRQKFIVLMRVWDLLRVDGNFTFQRVQIVNTVATAFNIQKYEVQLIEKFASSDELHQNNFQDILIISSEKELLLSPGEQHCKHLYVDSLDKRIYILRIPSADLLFIKYPGKSEIYVNGLLLNSKHINILATGSILKIPSGTIYYSDLVAKFNPDASKFAISFSVKDLEYEFPNGVKALRGISFANEGGELVAIMGASGAGKTTLLNVISGIEKPSSGNVMVNAFNLHKEYDKVKGLIGYIAQDDLLIEELTVFENLYYSAKLSFKDKTNEELVALVDKTLVNLCLDQIKTIKVGSPLNKKISGGQRKRLNIALELVREPAILFVDEPTSGLSSKDSENVMELLKELSLKGKLIYVVIHQPSSDIFKLFDKLIVLDTGGFQIYTGNPVDAVIYFKSETNQINPDVGECYVCGNVNPELIFNIIEAKVVDDFGRFTTERKIQPEEWSQKFKANFVLPSPTNTTERTLPPTASIPNKIKQWVVFVQRDVKSKIGNVQYLTLNLLEAPILAAVLSLLIRYRKGAPGGNYTFFHNQNLPAYIFMSIVVALFIGLTVSAEEIFRDKKILKREKFLNLSRASYLFSKVGILFTISAIQTITFVLIGNFILNIKGMYFSYWVTLFSVSCFANTLGLNISSALNSAVTIYIVIPLLVIPQMVLGGAMFSFDKINDWFGGGGEKTPLLADFFASRWAYEALAVQQFKSNPYSKHFFAINKKESFVNYRTAYWLPKLSDLNSKLKRQVLNNEHINDPEFFKNKKLIYDELTREIAQNIPPKAKIEPPKSSDLNDLQSSINILNEFYSKQQNRISDLKNSKIQKFSSLIGDIESFKNTYTNESLNELVLASTEKDKFRIENGRIYQIIEPIYRDPQTGNPLDYRAHMYAPRKNLFGKLIDTFYFNIAVIWLMSIFLFVTLYFDVLSKIINSFSRSNHTHNNKLLPQGALH